jgi:hypothetical protein
MELAQLARRAPKTDISFSGGRLARHNLIVLISQRTP